MGTKGWMVWWSMLAGVGCATTQTAMLGAGEGPREYYRDDGVLVVCHNQSIVGTHMTDTVCEGVEGSDLHTQHAIDQFFLNKPDRQFRPTKGE